MDYVCEINDKICVYSHKSELTGKIFEKHNCDELQTVNWYTEGFIRQFFTQVNFMNDTNGLVCDSKYADYLLWCICLAVKNKYPNFDNPYQKEIDHENEKKEMKYEKEKKMEKNHMNLKVKTDQSTGYHKAK
jgi:hypothetical protein